MKALYIFALVALCLEDKTWAQRPLCFGVSKASFSLRSSQRTGSSFTQRVPAPRIPAKKNRNPGQRQGVRMDFGYDGFFGVGAPEVAVIVAVGYFLLGPTELYRLTKEIGKLVTQLRNAATEASTQFSEAMESQLAINEIKQAADELQDAFSPFSFQSRSQRINYDAGLDPTTQTPQSSYPDTLASEEPPIPAASTATSDDVSASVGGEDLLEPKNGAEAAQTFEQSKFHSQLNGDWNEKVLQGEGPWNENYELNSDMVDNQWTSSDDLLFELKDLEQRREAELTRLEQEFEMQRRLVEDQFSATRDMVESFARRKAQIDARVKMMNDELDSKESMLTDTAAQPPV